MAVSDKVAAQLAQVDSSPDLGAALLHLLTEFKTISSPATIADDLTAFADYLFDHSTTVGIVSARAVLDATITTLKAFEDDDVWVTVGQHLLSRLQGGGSGSSGSGSSSGASSTPQFLEQVATICDLVATAFEHQERFVDAARLLASIPLDSSQRRVSQEDKVRVWVRIVRDYLEVDDSTAAESYLNKLKSVIFDVHDQELNLHFKLSQARINDAKREFLAASTAYHDISYSPAIAEEERLHTLSMAIKCAILAPAGPTRSRVLGRLYKDDRVSGGAGDGRGGVGTGPGGGGGGSGLRIDENEFSILEKMFLNRLLTPAEVDKFAQSLQPHQLAKTADGSTVLAKAVVEHNLLGVSRLYRNIELGNLARLLGLDDVHKAEETTARMVEQGRLLGRIDQIEGLVWFEGGEASGAKGSGRTESAVDKEMRQWDANVQSLAEEVEAISNTLQQKYPNFALRNLAV